MDKSNGYEPIAKRFIEIREQSDIGTSSVRDWSQTLPKKSVILDIGCGTGIPISKVLIDEGMTVYGIDASNSLIDAFRHNFPKSQVACESVEESMFFNRKFDAILSWGLIFLLPQGIQTKILQKAANALQTGGKLLFTAPYQKTKWEDVMTSLTSRSLGTKKYISLLSESGLKLIEEFEDEGGNHYFNAVKV